MGVWLYWSGGQNSFTLTLPAIGETGWATINVQSVSGKLPLEITDIAFGFNNWTATPVTGSITIYDLIAVKNVSDLQKYDIEILPVDIETFDAIAPINGGSIDTPLFADAAAVIAALPTSVMANGSTIEIPVTSWADTDTFNPAVAGSYTFTATLGTIPNGGENPLALVLTVEVQVNESVIVFNNFDSYVDTADFVANATNIVGFRIVGGTAFVRSNGELVIVEGDGHIIQNVNTTTGTAGIRIYITKAELPANIQYIAFYVKATDTANMVRFQSFIYTAGGTYAEITSTIVSNFSELGAGTIVYIPVSSLLSTTTQLSLVVNYNSGVTGQLIWDDITLLESLPAVE